MNKPIIGITTRTDLYNEREIVKVNKSIINKVVSSGGIPLLIPLNSDDFSTASKNLLNILKICNGFIIPGGNTWNLNDEIIIKYAVENDVPLLGICAGMQAIANMNNFCGSIQSDKTIRINSNINHNVLDNDYVHEIIIGEGLLFHILGKTKICVNSRHMSTVIVESFFNIDAKSHDDIIEAIHIPNKKFILGLQWHPEDLNDENSLKIFQSLIEFCKK